MARDAPHGIARYALALFKFLPEVAPDLAFVPLRCEPGSELRAQARFLSPFEQLELPLILRRARPALFHATSFSVPRIQVCPLVLTLHDVIHLSVPEESSPTKRLYFRHVVRPAAKTARAVITVSSFAREQISRHLEIDPAHIRVIANGIDAIFEPPGAAQLFRVRKKLGLPEKFALYLGNTKPHKGVDTLVAAAKRLAGRIPVIIAGDNRAQNKLELGNVLRNLGVVADEDLPALYAACTVFVFPSRMEGAGLPPLEAMACGAPVISARAASMPEMLGDAVEYFEPDDDVGLADLLERVVNDDGLRHDLTARGLARAKLFSWRACAVAHAEVYRAAIAR